MATLNTKAIFHYLTVLTFLLSFLLQTFSKDLIVADYYANTSAYAKNCINKKKPRLKCKGKCQMIKKLKEQEEKSQDNPEGKPENKREIFLSSRSFFASIKPPVDVEASNPKYGIYSSGKSIVYSFDIFHPPQI